MGLNIFLGILAILCMCGMFLDDQAGENCTVGFIFMVIILVGWNIANLIIV